MASLVVDYRKEKKCGGVVHNVQLMRSVFSYLTLPDYNEVKYVCKDWNKACTDEDLLTLMCNIWWKGLRLFYQEVAYSIKEALNVFLLEIKQMEIIDDRKFENEVNVNIDNVIPALGVSILRKTLKGNDATTKDSLKLLKRFTTNKTILRSRQRIFLKIKENFHFNNTLFMMFMEHPSTAEYWREIRSVWKKNPEKLYELTNFEPDETSLEDVKVNIQKALQFMISPYLIRMYGNCTEFVKAIFGCLEIEFQKVLGPRQAAKLFKLCEEKSNLKDGFLAMNLAMFFKNVNASTLHFAKDREIKHLMVV